MIALKERSAAERILAPRLRGARALLENLQEGELLVLFSAAISATGVFGQVDFCAASAYLDALAQSRRRRPGPRVVALDWGTAHWDRWEGASGAGFEALMARLREIQASVGITVEEGIEALGRALATGEPQIVVSTEDLDALIDQAASASVTDFLGAAQGAAPGAVAVSRDDGREVITPASGTERHVAIVWSELLGVAPIGRTDNFFDLGGNSLLAIQLASRLRKEFDVDLAIASLFESADLASLAAAVDSALAERREAEEVERLLAEIEGLSEEQIREELSLSADAPDGSMRSRTTSRTPAAGAP
jgi:acyl carrier protein